MEEDKRGPRRRRVVTALLVAGVLAAVPAGVALAGGSGDAGSAGSDAAQPALEVQNGGQGDREAPRGFDRGDCPEKEKDGSAPSEAQQL